MKPSRETKVTQRMLTPVIGDRYVHRERSAEVMEITTDHVVLEVTEPQRCFRKPVTHAEYPVLVQRSRRFGAIFKPAPHDPTALRL